jgi:stringent starvation protein B
MGDVVQFRPRPKEEPKPYRGTPGTEKCAPNEKRDALLRLMELGVAMVHLDARKPGVVVPPEHAKDFDLRLNFSWRYRIGDLNVGDDKIVGTLSFSGRSFRCEVPWSAVFGITSARDIEIGEVYLKDLPDELGKPPGG